MRCRVVKEMLEELGTGELPAGVREHLAGCASCQAYDENREMLRAGFRALAKENLPETPIGFGTRVIRRLEEAGALSEPAREFLERAGRRVVYACLVLAMTILLGLLLPPWSPLRGAATMDLSPTPQLQTAEADTVFSDEATVTHSTNEPASEGVPRNPK